jgi:hypothetical protein
MYSTILYYFHINININVQVFTIFLYFNSYLQQDREKENFRSRDVSVRRRNSSERKQPYSRVLYLVLFDTSLQSQSVTLYSKF